MRVGLVKSAVYITWWGSRAPRSRGDGLEVPQDQPEAPEALDTALAEAAQSIVARSSAGSEDEPRGRVGMEEEEEEGSAAQVREKCHDTLTAAVRIVAIDGVQLLARLLRVWSQPCYSASWQSASSLATPSHARVERCSGLRPLA